MLIESEEFHKIKSALVNKDKGKILMMFLKFAITFCLSQTAITSLLQLINALFAYPIRVLVRESGLLVLTGMASLVLGESCTTSIKDFTIFPPRPKKKVTPYFMAFVQNVLSILEHLSDRAIPYIAICAAWILILKNHHMVNISETRNAQKNCISKFRS